MGRLFPDLRLALRRLRQSPGFTLAAVLTLALGIGANTTVFSALNTLLFRPLPVERPGELAFVNNGTNRNYPTQSYPDYLDLRDRNRVFSGLVGYRLGPISLSSASAAGNARVWGYLATGNYFEVLGIKAFRGRLFTPADDRTPGAHPVCVLSYGCWVRRFGGDVGRAIGRAVKLNGLDFTIIGVAPPGFNGTEVFVDPELWVPIMMQAQIEPGNGWLTRRGSHNTLVLGRLKPAVTRPQAEAALNLIATQLGREYPSTNSGMRVRLTEPGLMGDLLRGPVTGFAAVLMAVAALVLLIACANLAGLLLARAADRQKETAIRLALGAGRRQLIRQWLTESLVLSLAGAAAGLLAVVWLTDLFAAWRPPVEFPALTALALDGRVLGFTAALSLAACLLFGSAPALQAARVPLIPALKNDAARGRWRRWQLRDLLVATQIALSVMLLSASILVLRSLRQALDMHLGFNPRGAVSVSFDLDLQGYSEERGREFQQRILERAARLPGIRSVALTSRLPLGLDRSYNNIYVEGKPAVQAAEVPDAMSYEITPGYFGTMETRLIAGRDFDERDTAQATQVAIVNQAFARRLLQVRNPVGQRFRFHPTGRWTQIVGLVEDGKYLRLGEEPTPVVFRAHRQSYSGTSVLVARSSLPPEQAVAALRHAVLALDPAMPVYDARSLTEHLDFAMLPARLAASVLGAFGVLAIALAATGVYGVIAYAVARRTREIGIRMAIGSSQGRVLGLVLRRTLLMLVVGGAAGGLGALAAGGLLSGLLYGLSPRDPATIGLALALMAAVALAASWRPARRALRIDPALALREE